MDLLALLRGSGAFNVQGLRSLSYIGSGGADLGEVVASWSAAEKSVKEDPNQDPGVAWFEAWTATAERLELLSKQVDRKSSGQLLLRAAECRRTSEFFLRGLDNHTDSRRQDAIAKLRQNFSAYLDLEEIQYEWFDFGNCMGYAVFNQRNVGTLVIPSGYDSFAEEGWINGGMGAFQRGFNVVLLDGPGQGHVVRRLEDPHFMTRNEYVDAVASAICTLDENHFSGSKIFLMGRSFGGCLALLVSSDKRMQGRLNGLIVDPPQPDFQVQVGKMLGKLGLDQLFQDDKQDEFDRIFEEKMMTNFEKSFYWKSRMGVHHVKSPFRFFKVLASFDAQDVLEHIKCPLLAIRNHSEHLSVPNYQLIEMKCRKVDFVDFHESDGAMGHCVQGAGKLFEAHVCTWLIQNSKIQ